MLLTDISPRAAKLYLALSTLSPPKAAPPPTARIRIPSLARLLHLSLPARPTPLREPNPPPTHHPASPAAHSPAEPRAHQLHPFPYTHPLAGYAPDLQPAAVLAPPTLQPAAALPTPALQPVAAPPKPTPIAASKTPSLQPVAAIKPNHLEEPTDDPLDSPLVNPALLQFLMNALSPEEKSTLLAPYQPLLASPHPASTEGATP